MCDNNSNLMEMVNSLSSTASAYRQSILLLTANRFDLFTNLSGTSSDAAQVAAAMSWDRRACEAFLNALTAMELLEKKADRYSNSPITERLLVKGVPEYQGDILNHNLNLWERWTKVGDVLQSGLPIRDPQERRSPEEQRNFINGMANIARFSAEKLWERVDLTGKNRLLDVGGGPGTYSFAASKHFPELECVVFDLPEVEAIFEQHHEASGTGDKVRYHAGDFTQADFLGNFDAVLMSNIIHSWGEKEVRALLGNLHDVVDPGGLLLIKDFFISEEGTGPLFAALFTINMLVSTPSGRCYTRNEVEAWSEEGGFKLLDFIELTEQAGVFIAQKCA